MPDKGWIPEMAIIRGNEEIVIFQQSSRQLVIKVQGQGDTSKVAITLISP